LTKHALTLPADYTRWLSALKRRINGARQQALLSVNQEQIKLYHDIGREILERQKREGWGSRVIDHLSSDLCTAFPEMRGFSSRNLKYMRTFAEACPDLEIGQQAAAQLPWFHIVTLITKLGDPALREWYAREAVMQSWSRETLNLQIRERLHLRKGAAVTNFERRLARRQVGRRRTNATSKMHSCATSLDFSWNLGLDSPSWVGSSVWKSGRTSVLLTFFSTCERRLLDDNPTLQ